MSIDLKKPVAILKKGGVIVYPTETAYAIGCSAQNHQGVLKIFKIKKRSKNKTLPLIVANIKMARIYGIFNNRSLKLAKKYWPGPLTLIVKANPFAKKNLSKLVINKGKIAIRVSSCSIASQLSFLLKKPIISSSANISGQAMLFSKEKIKKELRSKEIDYFLLPYNLKKTEPSTIIEIGKNRIKILRKGAINLFREF